MVATMTTAGRALLRSLTSRERQVLALVCSGHTNRSIAQRLGTSEQVIKNYLRGVYAKSGARHRCELVVLAFKSGVVACNCAQRSPVQSSVEGLGQQSENLLP